MASYATTSIILYLVSAWLGINFFTSEPEVQRHISVIHMRSELRYALGRIFAIWIIAIVLTVFAVFYPILNGSFDHQATVLQILAGLIGHLIIAMLGILSAVIFHSLFRLRFIQTSGGLLICLVLSVAAGNMAEHLQGPIAILVWLLPPAGEMMYGLTNFDTLSMLKRMLYLGYPLLYMLIYGAFAIRVMKRKWD
jgi:hypothetical protein